MNLPLTPTADRLVTTFSLGRCRPASGTWGSLPPVIIAGLLLAFGVQGGGLVFGLVMAAIVGIFSGACVRFGDQAAAAFGRSDPSEVVADETAGMALVLAFLPATAMATPGLAVLTLVLAFLAFRLLDIVKPFPADWLERLPGGWGVLLDDIGAAIYAIIALHIAAIVI